MNNFPKSNNLKEELSKFFAIDLRSAKQIFSMKISCDKKSRKLWLSQEVYVEKILERFNMGKAKSICSLLARHLKLSSKYCPTSEKEKQEIRSLCFNNWQFNVCQVFLPMQLVWLVGFFPTRAKSI